MDEKLLSLVSQLGVAGSLNALFLWLLFRFLGARQEPVNEAIIQIGANVAAQTELLRQCVRGHEVTAERLEENGKALARLEVRISATPVNGSPRPVA